MMKQVFMLLIVGLLVAVCLSLLINLDPGYVRISVGNLLIESNLWVLLTANFVAAGILIGIFMFIRRLFKVKTAMSNWIGNSGSTRAKNKTEKGLIALLEGNWSSATKLLSKSAVKSESPLVNYLGAARAANELGDVKTAEQLLKTAYESSPDASLAVGLAQAQIQLEQDQLEQCLATLLRLKKLQPSHHYVLKLLKEVYIRLGDWQELLSIVPLLKKIPKIDKEQLSKLEQQSWNNLFIQKAEEFSRAEFNGDDTNKKGIAAEELARLWKQVPEPIRFEGQIIETYARQLSNLGSDIECESLLRKTLHKHWNDELVLLYGLIQGKNAQEQLKYAENWLKERPNNAKLLLTLGRLSLRNELWGKALEYFEASNKLNPTQESYAELYRLSSKLSVDEVKNQHLMQGFVKTLELPNLPLPPSAS